LGTEERRRLKGGWRKGWRIVAAPALAGARAQRKRDGEKRWVWAEVEYEYEN
jgi:hypothetical protein